MSLEKLYEKYPDLEEGIVEDIYDAGFSAGTAFSQSGMDFEMLDEEYFLDKEVAPNMYGRECGHNFPCYCEEDL